MIGMLNDVASVESIIWQPELMKIQEFKKISMITLAVTSWFKNMIIREYETDFVNINLWEGIVISLVEYCGDGSLVHSMYRLATKSLLVEWK